MYVAWLSIQYQAFTYSTASGTYGFSRVLMIFRFITIRATEPCLNLEYSGFRSRETNSPYNLIGGARRRLSSRDRVQPPLPLSILSITDINLYNMMSSLTTPTMMSSCYLACFCTLYICLALTWPGNVLQLSYAFLADDTARSASSCIPIYNIHMYL